MRRDELHDVAFVGNLMLVVFLAIFGLWVGFSIPFLFIWIVLLQFMVWVMARGWRKTIADYHYTIERSAGWQYD